MFLLLLKNTSSKTTQIQVHLNKSVCRLFVETGVSKIETMMIAFLPIPGFVSFYYHYLRSSNFSVLSDSHLVSDRPTVTERTLYGFALAGRKFSLSQKTSKSRFFSPRRATLRSINPSFVL